MKYTHSIILLHGFSMNSNDMKYYCDKLDKNFPQYKFKYIIPNAPKRKITIYNNKIYQSWYDYLTPHCDSEPDINNNQLLQIRKKIHKLLDKEINYHKNPSKVFLSGISQGCCVAIDAGITYSQKIGGIFGFKGHVINKSLKDFSKNKKYGYVMVKMIKLFFIILPKNIYES